ncbi:MAG: CocE/NonD family hydrolase [Flavobacteriales bacterium]|nr:CocE/NonD family hydrolase [Flavobacteriales bacterium]
MKKIILSVFTATCALTGYAQLEPVELEIPMSDGQFLAADLYQPAGCSSCPVILIQTPYGKVFYQFIGLPLGVGENIDDSPYAFVIVDWRGRFESADADYEGAPTTGEDGYDVVEWIAEQSWCNGKIGTWGPSALGKAQFMTAKEQPPHLTCICPLVAAPQTMYTEYYPGGALRTEYLEQLDNLGFGVSLGVLPFPHYNIVWSTVESSSFYEEEISVPALMIGGWYDHNADLMVDFFEAIRTNSPEDVKDEHKLLFGPWIHGGSGQAEVGNGQQGELEYPNAAAYQNTYALAFFDYYLRELDNGWDENPVVRYYHMGENEWHDETMWPPSSTPLNLFLHADLTLSEDVPIGEDPFLSFNYDPEDPSPTVGGPTLRNDLVQGPYDQVDVEARNDILVFSTEELTTPIDLQGKAKVHLYVSCSMPDTDVAVRLCDVYPDGRSMLITDGIIRMRFRDGYTTADTSFMEPGVVYEAVAEFAHTSISILEGHRLRLDLSGSNYPRFNRNMNSGDTMYPNNSMDTLVNALPASTTIWMDAIQSSYLEIPKTDLTTSMAEIAALTAPAVSPQPASDKAFVRIFEQSAQTISVSDSKGRRVFSASLSGAAVFPLDVSQWPSGLYTVVLEGDAVLPSTAKLLVVH